MAERLVGHRGAATAEDTIALGAQLGEQLRAGDVVVLSGPLGAGKTVLAKGIAQAMDVEGPVISPTFVLARVHRARQPGAPAMIHVDMYRLLDHASRRPARANSTRWTSTPISMTRSSWWSGARDWPSDFRTATSTSGSNAGRIPKCAPRSGSGAGREHDDPRDRHRDACGHRGHRAAGRARRAGRASHRRRPRARRAAHPECAWRAGRRRTHRQRSDAVVVGCGPGPFTGLRVGMATAAAYGHALGIPVHGVCSLDAIGIESTGTTCEVLVVTDARRREVYWARYRDGVRVDGPSVNTPADVPGADDALSRPPRAIQRHEPVWCAPWPTGGASPVPLIPLYLRRPDAKPSVVTR